jgi:hypothetical protein
MRVVRTVIVAIVIVRVAVVASGGSLAESTVGAVVAVVCEASSLVLQLSVARRMGNGRRVECS